MRLICYEPFCITGSIQVLLLVRNSTVIGWIAVTFRTRVHPQMRILLSFMKLVTFHVR